MYIDKLDDIVNEYNNTYHRTIKMKPVDVNDNTYIDFEKEVNIKDPKFKIERYMPNWSEEVFIISNIKNTVPWTYVINDLNDEEIIGTFYEKELQKTNQKEFRIEKVLKEKGGKNDVVKKDVYDKLVTKVNNIDTSGFVLKTKA